MMLSQRMSSSSWAMILRLVTACLVVALATLANAEYQHYDVPLEKANPPLMKPRETFPEITHRVYFTIEIDGQEQPEKIIFGLFGTNTPKTVQNFVALAQCDHGNGKISGKPLCYKGSPLHRIVPYFGISGGDFVFHDGTGGESIFGSVFEDESFSVRHNRPGLISMSNRGRNTNGSQFFINTSKTQWLDGKHVVFGMLLEGRDLINDIEEYGQLGGNPTAKIVIKDCGALPLLPEDKEVHYVTEWVTE